MRRLHRWFGLICSLFFLVISLTGVGMQTIALTQPRREGPPTAAGQAPQGGASERDGPPSSERGPRKPGLYQQLQHIHAGEFAGPAGRIISLLMGLALLFFSISGLWMYWSMYDGRSKSGRNQVFW